MSKSILVILLIVSLVVFTFCTKKSTEPEEQLLPPTNLTISLVENNKIQINWIDNSTNETAYLIDRKMGTFNWLENFGEVVANIMSFTDNIPTNSDTVFSYRIRAFNDENYSVYSDTIAWFSTNSTPSNLEIEQITQDTLQLSWQDNSVGEQYFRIDRKIDEKGWQVDYAHVPADTTNFLDYTTALYDTCNYKVFAVTGISHSDSTENAFIPFLPAPTNLELQALGASEVKLTWQDNCHNEEGYRIYIKRGETTEWDSLNIAENTKEWTDVTVIPGIENYYKVCAYYENDTSGFIDASLNTLPAPTNLYYEILSPNSILLKWNDNSNWENGFIIERKINNDNWSEFSSVSSNTTEYTDNTINEDDTFNYRVYAYVGENCSDYSNEIFYGTVTDIDGNVYQTILIGDQEWMMENLKVTHYRNGDPIPHTTDGNEWMNTTDGAYCVYNNEPSNADTYGALYNWYAVDDSRNIAPTGWHVPTDDEWQTLVDYLGGSSVAGGKMKEAGFEHWISPNTGATNESGFTALPGGYRSSTYGHFSTIGHSAYFWSSTVSHSSIAWYRELDYDSSEVYRHNDDENCGFSIRCLRD